MHDIFQNLKINIATEEKERVKQLPKKNATIQKILLPKEIKKENLTSGKKIFINLIILTLSILNRVIDFMSNSFFAK